MTAPQITRFFLVGLPLGLLLLGTGGMFLHLRNEKQEADVSGRVAVGKPLSERGLRDHIQTLAGTVGARHPGAPDRLRAGEKYLQSTLGPANLGYRVTRREVGPDSEWSNDILELPGVDETLRKETVLVVAALDTPPGTPGANAPTSGLAALMSLAESFGGARNARTLVFLACMTADTGGQPNGAQSYARYLKDRGDHVVAVLVLDSLGCWRDEPGTQQTPAGPVQPLPETGNFLAFAGNEAARSLTESAAVLADRATTLDCVALTLPGDGAAWDGEPALAFCQAGFPVVRATDTGSLRDPLYHQAGDTPDRLDYARLFTAVQGIEAVLRQWVNPVPSRPR